MEMTREEKINKICEKVMVTREEAEAALNACGDDILDAVLYLEASGRLRTAKGVTFTEEYYEEPVKKNRETKQTRKSETFGEAVGKFCGWVVKLIKAGCENYLDIERNEETVIRIPLIIPAILLIPCFWLEAILLIVGLFCGCRYSFSGPAFQKDNKLNQASRKASEKAEKFKEEFNRGFDNYEDNE